MMHKEREYRQNENQIRLLHSYISDIQTKGDLLCEHSVNAELAVAL